MLNRHFLQIAMGSASELEYHLLLARDLGYLETVRYEPLNDQVTEIKRMLTSFIQELKADRRILSADRSPLILTARA